jgi:hypothetical protein
VTYIRHFERLCSILHCLRAVGLIPTWVFALEVMTTAPSDSVNSTVFNVNTLSLRAVNV